MVCLSISLYLLQFLYQCLMSFLFDEIYSWVFYSFDAIVHGNVFKDFLSGRYLPAFPQHHIQFFLVNVLGTAGENGS